MEHGAAVGQAQQCAVTRGAVEIPLFPRMALPCAAGLEFDVFQSFGRRRSGRSENCNGVLEVCKARQRIHRLHDLACEALRARYRLLQEASVDINH